MSVREFLLPDLGEGLTDAEIVRWLVAVGDNVEIDQPLVEVVTAKANAELPSPFAGTVSALHGSVGDVVEVGKPLVSIDPRDDAGGGEPLSEIRPETATNHSTVASTAAPAAEGASGNVLVGYGTGPGRGLRRRRPEDTPAEPTRVPAVVSPVVRRLAHERGVDLTTLSGSGPNGLIKRADVEAAATGPAAAGERRLPIRGLQRQMVELVTRSRREIPEATVWVDVDATELVRARAALRAADAAGEGVGLVSLLARFCVLGLQRWPVLNGRVEGDEVVVGDAIGMGFAAQTERGLVVPVVRGAERLSLRELDAEVRRLSAAARDGSLTPADMAGGTFTVNNYGIFGVDGSAAIINHPQAAMIGVGRIVERPWAVGGEVVARPVTQLTLVFDHRVCDGGVAGGFLRLVADLVEQPLLAL